MVGTASLKLTAIVTALWKAEQVPINRLVSVPDTLKAMIEGDGCSSQTIFNVNKTILFWMKMHKWTFNFMRRNKTFVGPVDSDDWWRCSWYYRLKPFLVYNSENPGLQKINLKLACWWFRIHILKLGYELAIMRIGLVTTPRLKPNVIANLNKFDLKQCFLLTMHPPATLIDFNWKLFFTSKRNLLA